ncbi:MAG: hypothetical protein KGO47_07185 [Cyanobacteria bacterium REEB417]|nr:hypothetical protein [Cyanobacteria bacterium REEB417]
MIAEGASPRFADLSETGQAQLAHGLTLDAEVLAALSQPHVLNDQQLLEVVGGIDPVLAGLITLGITTLGSVLMHWINRHYDSKKTV